MRWRLDSFIIGHGDWLTKTGGARECVFVLILLIQKYRETTLICISELQCYLHGFYSFFCSFRNNNTSSGQKQMHLGALIFVTDYKTRHFYVYKIKAVISLVYNTFFGL